MKDKQIDEREYISTCTHLLARSLHGHNHVLQLARHHQINLLYVIFYFHKVNTLHLVELNLLFFRTLLLSKYIHGRSFDDGERTIVELKLLFFRTLFDWVFVRGYVSCVSLHHFFLCFFSTSIYFM